MNLESNKALHTATTATEIETLGWQTLEHVREVLESIQIQVPPMHTEPFIVSLGKLIQIVEENTLLLIFHNKNTEAQLAIQQCIRLLDNLGFNKDIPVLNPQALEPKFFPKRASKKLSPTSNPSMAPKHSKVTVTSTPNTHEVKTSWIMSKSINSFNKTMFTLPRAAAKKLGEMFVLYKGQRSTSELAEEMGLATYSIEKLISGKETPMYVEDVLRLILDFYVNTVFESDVIRKQLSTNTIYKAKREARLLMGQITEGFQETPIADSISYSKATIMSTVENTKIKSQNKKSALPTSSEVPITNSLVADLNVYLTLLDLNQELNVTYGQELTKLHTANDSQERTSFHVVFLRAIASLLGRKLAANELNSFQKGRLESILKRLNSVLPDDTGILQADNTRGVELGMKDMWTIQAVATAMNITRENFSSILNATKREAAILNSVGPRSHETDRTKMISENTLYNLFIQSKDKLEDTDNTCQKFQKLVQNKIGHLLFKGNKLPTALSSSNEEGEDSNKQEFSEPDVPSKVDKQELKEQAHIESGLELRKQKAYNVLAQSILSSSIASLDSLKETLEDDLKTSAPQLLAMAILQGEAVYTHICSFPIGLRDNTTGADHLLYIKQCIQGVGMKIEESIDTTRKVVSIFAVALPY